ncbi:RagB/SusD family nutrient uptake outer membrane protein [Frigoriflavimonas asaccharolytica]|uniref:Outer membrane starch-binding protein n=1 Tax=Frigoriflavimonas asaccharolytica TaxID=2735899 RepID=A0A8J8G7F8_9FLAO|nr:RagB/SusD family nutrient uptake outer membrane protein [Frigoriflavimonas asaccharolytica]NRS92694.1 hypothetical protein [Frigoriflavimonas asaccharolytica]
MKNIFKISGLALLLFFTSSCNRDQFEPFAPGVIFEEDALNTSADMSLLMNSALAIGSSRSESEYVSIFTDEVGIGFANGGQGITDEYVFNLNPGSDFPTAIWAEGYLAISRLNRIIDAADNRVVPTSAANAKVIAGIKAQALTLRAYHHLRILSYFTTDMKNDAALSGIIADKILPADVNTFKRNTNGEMYAFIQKDLTDAIAAFAIEGAAANPNYANVNFARGLKARAYSYKGDYVNAELWANQVISSGLTLATKTQYRTIFWTDAVVSEVIFRAQRTAQQNAQASNLHNAWFSISPQAAGSPLYEVSRSLHNKLNPGNLPATSLASLSDVRANLIIGPDSSINTNYTNAPDYRNGDRLIINKHGGKFSATESAWARTSTNGNNNSFKIMRLAEMYTIKAEARAKVSDYNGVRDAIKSIRDARNGAVTTLAAPASDVAAWKMILDEKRIEFAFEGYRYLDLKRLGTLANSGIDRDPADYSSLTSNYPGGNPNNLPLTSFKFTLPIPNIEVNVNTAIVQNPGY